MILPTEVKLGAAILVKSYLLCHPFSQYTEPHIQAFTILITLDHTPITIYSVYCPLKHTITPNQFNNFISTLGNNFIVVVGSDINAKHIQWGCHTNSPCGILFVKSLITITT